MDDLLTPVQTSRKVAIPTRRSLAEIRDVDNSDTEAIQPSGHDRESVQPLAAISNPEQVIAVLRSDLNISSLLQILRLLRTRDGFEDGFNIHSPGHLQSRIMNTLVDSTVPTFWPILGPKDRVLLLGCLKNLAGVSAIIVAVKGSTQSTSKKNNLLLGQLLSILEYVLENDRSLLEIWTNVSSALHDQVREHLAQKEIVNLFASGKIIALVAQAEDSLGTSNCEPRSSWMSHGAKYAAWLGRNIASMESPPQSSQSSSVPTKYAAQLLTKALNLGYPVQIVESFVSTILNSGADTPVKWLGDVIKSLSGFDKHQFLAILLRWMSTMSLESLDTLHVTNIDRDVVAFAAFLNMLLQADALMNVELEQIISSAAQTSTYSISVRRACVAVLAQTSSEELDRLLEKLTARFSDTMFINHSPIAQQESVAQLILLVAGHVHRQTPMALLLVTRASTHLQGVSNRLETSNKKARWLGMVVATALSRLVDKEGLRMNFGTDDMDTGEAKWYFELVKVEDSIGQLHDFVALLRKQTEGPPTHRKTRLNTKIERLPVLNGKQTFGPPRPPEMLQTEVIGDKVTEILEDETDEDDDLKPYARPGSDIEDSDEDATLVNRNKPRPPVYIRDLMRMLQDDKNHDRFQMGLKHAASLIRRKAGFGSEVKDHAEELASMLCNMQDPFDTEDFDELRLQALIAVVLSDFRVLGPWLSRLAFSGDFSLAQRCIMLSALGLGGRELAGFKNEDNLNPALPESVTDFPSKRLTSRLDSIYNPRERSVKRLEAASRGVEQQIMKPLALSAADKSTSHLDAVKIRTFSSRLSSQQRTKRKAPPNQLAQLFGEAVFFPLVSRYQQEIAAFGSGSLFVSVPFLLVTYLKTLALLFHASGPATYDLSEITTSLWSLLLSVRVAAAQDLSVMEAVLFSLLTLLEVNGDGQQRLAQENPKQLTETKEWVDIVFEHLGGGEMATEGSEEEMKVRSLAAGVLVKIGEIADGYQKILMGHMS